MPKSFVLFNTKDGNFWWLSTGVPMKFNDAIAAKAFQDRLIQQWGNDCGFVIRPIDDDLDLRWYPKAVEALRRGEWTRPDYIANMEARPEHCLRMNPECKPGQTNELMFYKDVFAGMAGKLSAISLRGYLEKYRCLRGSDIEYYERIYKAETTDIDGLMFASKPEDIVSVYTKYNPSASGVNGSCMRYSAETFLNHYDCPVHPAYVYGAGDLAVAYLIDKTGLTIARAICWPEKKVYSRVYDGTDLLHRYLKKHGFTKSVKYYGQEDGANPIVSLAGAKLLRIPHKDARFAGCFVMPYLDEKLKVVDAKDYFVLSNNLRDARPAVGSSYTNGWSVERLRPTIQCAHCGANVPEQNTLHVYNLEGGGARWCPHCITVHCYTCGATGRIFSNDVPKVVIDGETCSVWAANNNGFVLTCPLTNERFIKSKGVVVYSSYPAFTLNRILCSRKIVGRDDLVWRDCYSGNIFVKASVAAEKVFTQDREWRWTSPEIVKMGAAFRSDYNGKLYDIRYEQYVTTPDGSAIYCVASSHARGAKLRLERGQPLGGTPKEPADDKEDN